MLQHQTSSCPQTLQGVIKFTIPRESDDEKLWVAVSDEYVSFYFTDIINFMAHREGNLRFYLTHTCDDFFCLDSNIS